MKKQILPNFGEKNAKKTPINSAKKKRDDNLSPLLIS